MKGKISILIILLLQAFFHYSMAQTTGLKFSRVEGPGGSPLGKINGMTQDLHGYMWFVGHDNHCLYRYDGIRYTVFRHIDADPYSLGGTRIQSVYADDTGFIWIGMGEGLDQYNTETGIFKHYRHDPKDPESLSSGSLTMPVLKDKKGRVWVGTENGLDRLDEKTGKFTHYRHETGNSKSLSSNEVWNIYEDHQGDIWIATGDPWFNKDPDDGGLNRLNADGSFTRYMHDPNDPNSLTNNKVGAMFEDSRGVFWVGTGGDGLHTMNRKTGRFERHLYDPKKPDELSRPPLRRGEENDKITFITEDRSGKIWIGTMFSGMNRYDPLTNKITHFERSNGFPDSTSWNIFSSRDGELWITTEQANLYRVDPTQKSITSIYTLNPPAGFLEDNKGYLWVSTRGSGLYKFDQQLNVIHQFKHNPSDTSGLADNNVVPLFQNLDNMIWLGTDTGIRMLNTISQQFFRVDDSTVLQDLPNGGEYASIYQDRQGIMWLGTWGRGLISYHPGNHKAKRYLPMDNDSFSILSKNVGVVLEDRSGLLWTGSDNGVNRLDRKTERFSHYLVGNFTYNLFEDTEGRLWAGTGGGLFLYNPKEDKFYNFLEDREQFRSFSFGGITEDNDKNLWISSQLGIIKLNPVTKETFIYSNRFGIDPLSLVIWPKNYKNRKGQIFIPNSSGFYMFSPQELNVDLKFNIIINDLLINNRPVFPGKKSPIQKSIEDITDLEVKYNQNNIGFNFAAIDYRESQVIKYFYMLEGYDRDWRDVGDQKEKGANYFNLNYGKYVFRVKAFNSDGSIAETSLKIRVNPPWWLTWWAYAFYAILLGVLGYFLYRMQKQRIIARERQKAQQFELEQAKEIEKAYHELRSTQAQLIQSEKMASLGELTAGIAHEIQNPLNFVNNFSDINADLIDEADKELEEGHITAAREILNTLKDNENKIRNHGQRAGAIVKSMLQHSRTSTGQKELTDINALADEYLRLAYHGLRAKEKSFNAQLHTDFDPSIGKINIIPQDIGRVLLNLYNNAMYAVMEQKKSASEGFEPAVSVTTKKINNKIEISVKDNGTGIPIKILDKIFQPFFTTKPSGQGTGLGLSLSYDIIKAQGGDLTVKSKSGDNQGTFGGGSEFILQLPID